MVAYVDVTVPQLGHLDELGLYRNFRDAQKKVQPLGGVHHLISRKNGLGAYALRSKTLRVGVNPKKRVRNKQLPLCSTVR